MHTYYHNDCTVLSWEMSIEYKCMFFKREERRMRKKSGRMAFRADHLFNLCDHGRDEKKKIWFASAIIIGIETVIESSATLVYVVQFLFSLVDIEMERIKSKWIIFCSIHKHIISTFRFFSWNLVACRPPHNRKTTYHHVKWISITLCRCATWFQFFKRSPAYKYKYNRICLNPGFYFFFTKRHGQYSNSSILNPMEAFKCVHVTSEFIQNWPIFHAFMLQKGTHDSSIQMAYQMRAKNEKLASARKKNSYLHVYLFNIAAGWLTAFFMAQQKERMTS